MPYGEEIEINYQKNPQVALYEVMKVASKNNYAEPISWHGLGTNWLPQIDEYGSTSVEGGIGIKGSLSFQEENLKLSTTNYQIQKIDDNIYKRESGFEVEGGLYERKVWVRIEEIIKEPNETEEEFQRRKAEYYA